MSEAAFHESNQLATVRQHIAAEIRGGDPFLAHQLVERQVESDLARGQTTTASLEQLDINENMDAQIAAARARRVDGTAQDNWPSYDGLDRFRTGAMPFRRHDQLIDRMFHQTVNRTFDRMLDQMMEDHWRRLRDHMWLDWPIDLRINRRGMAQEGRENQSEIQREVQRDLEYEEAVRRMELETMQEATREATRDIVEENATDTVAESTEETAGETAEEATEETAEEEALQEALEGVAVETEEWTAEQNQEWVDNIMSELET